MSYALKRLLRSLGPLLLTLSCIGATGQQSAPAVLSVQAATLAFGWNFDTATITAQKVADGLYVLFGLGGNIAALVGEDGTLIVDDMFPQLHDKINATLVEIGGEAPSVIINTHGHFDHSLGNLAFGRSDAKIIAHTNAEAFMRTGGFVNLVQFKVKEEPYPEYAIPQKTFENHHEFKFNGITIHVDHGEAAHTSGDAIVVFKELNAIHFGDVFNNLGYPFIDADNGGSIDGMIETLNHIQEHHMNDATVVIPGHGEVTDMERYRDYVAMLQGVRAKVMNLIDEGYSLEAVLAANVTADFDTKFNPASAPLLVNRTYISLTKSN